MVVLNTYRGRHGYVTLNSKELRDPLHTERVAADLGYTVEEYRFRIQNGISLNWDGEFEPKTESSAA